MLSPRVDLYPHSPLLRAKLAVALQAAGADEEFHREALEALRLDRITPHEDREASPPVARQPSGQPGQSAKLTLPPESRK